MIEVFQTKIGGRPRSPSNFYYIIIIIMRISALFMNGFNSHTFDGTSKELPASDNNKLPAIIDSKEQLQLSIDGFERAELKKYSSHFYLGIYLKKSFEEEGKD